MDMIIETSRLIMRPFTENDLDIVMSLYSNEKIMRYMPNDLMDEVAAEKHLNKIVSDWEEIPQVSYEMAVILKSNQKKIGRTRIHMEVETETAMIGWLLLEENWGKGYATEITQAMNDYCFNVLNVHRVCALCHPENIRSWKVLEKCNMRKEAHFIQKCKYHKNNNVTWEDELEYAILKSEKV